MAAVKKTTMKQKIKAAKAKVKGKGVLMSKKESDALLGMVKTTPKKKVATKKAMKKKATAKKK